MKAHEAARSPCMVIYKCIILVNPTLDAIGAFNVLQNKLTALSSLRGLGTGFFKVLMFCQNPPEF